jgi:hypothetical protein
MRFASSAFWLPIPELRWRAGCRACGRAAVCEKLQQAVSTEIAHAYAESGCAERMPSSARNEGRPNCSVKHGLQARCRLALQLLDYGMRTDEPVSATCPKVVGREVEVGWMNSSAERVDRSLLRRLLLPSNVRCSGRLRRRWSLIAKRRPVSFPRDRTTLQDGAYGFRNVDE